MSESSSRVVERPRARARSTSAAFAAAIGANDASSSSSAANRSKNSLICSSRARRERHEPLGRRPHGGGDHLGVGGRDVEQVPRVLDDDQTIAGSERLGQIGGHHRHPISAEGDLLSGVQRGQR